MVLMTTYESNAVQILYLA